MLEKSTHYTNEHMKKTPHLFSDHFMYWLDFNRAMTVKEIKARYKHALLGFLWVLLNPLLQMAIIGFVFQFFIPVQVNNYFEFLFAGLLVWNFFSYSVLKAVPSFVYERALIQKAKFPRESIVLSLIFSNFFHFLISLMLFSSYLLISKIIFDQIKLSFTVLLITIGIKILLLIIALAWSMFLTVGLSLIGASLNVRYRDVSFMFGAVMPLWFYATPVIYTLNLLPVSLQRLAYLNPMTSIVQLFQSIFVDLPLPTTEAVLLSLLSSLAILGLGLGIFKKESPFFDDWI